MRLNWTRCVELFQNDNFLVFLSHNMPNNWSPCWLLYGLSNHSGWGNLCTMMLRHHCIYHFRNWIGLSRRRRHNVRRWPVCMLFSIPIHPPLSQFLWRDNNTRHCCCDYTRFCSQTHCSPKLFLPRFPWYTPVSPIPHIMFWDPYQPI